MERAYLPLSTPALQWLRSTGQRIPLRTAWQAHWNRLNWFLSKRIAAQQPVRLEDPVLIVGPWRSGTTAMHQLMADAAGLATPQTWQCMNACTFSLVGQPAANGTVKRPMDGLSIQGSSPQEDEFALLTLGVPSAYRAFLAPDRLGELLQTLDQKYWLSHPGWEDTWVAFLQAVARSSAPARQPLLLKSPNHTFRLQAILRRFPKSRLLWMARDPSPLLHSNLKMWAAMCRLYAAAQPAADTLAAFLQDVLQESCKTIDWCTANVPPDQFVVVSAEDLKLQPEATVRAAADRLKIAIDGARLQESVAALPVDSPEPYGSDVPSTCAEAVVSLRLAHQRALASHGLAPR